MIPATLHFIIAMIASAIIERMQRKLDYVQEEVRVLKEVVLATTGSARISFFFLSSSWFTDDLRRSWCRQKQ